MASMLSGSYSLPIPSSSTICFKVCKKQYIYDVEHPGELTPIRITPQSKHCHLTQSKTGFVERIQERTRRYGGAVYHFDI